MLGPTVIATKNLFYAVGNTPATSLTRHLPQGSDANILLLGCGDVRHILFTAYSEQGFPSRKLDITCCDWQDHVIARNILFLSFLYDDDDGVNTDTLWNIYYHRYLSISDMQVVQTRIRRFLEASSTLEEWHDSRYGATLRFCDMDTFNSTRAIWSEYDEAVASKDAKSYGDRFKAAMEATNKYKKDTYAHAPGAYSYPRSVAPMFMKLGMELDTLIASTWETGRVGSTEAASAYPNPVFATAISEGVPLAYPSNPMVTFHLATAGANLSKLSPLKPGKGNTSGSRLTDAARIQFASWVAAYRKLSSNFVVRFVSADCFAFCQTLQHNLHTGETTANLYRRQLDPRPLVLDEMSFGKTSETAPRMFDVIDTSNIADHLGTLNLLVCAAPLLTDKPRSTLYTENMAIGSSSKDSFESLVGGYTKTVALLLGMSPIEYWTNATSVSSTDELLLATLAVEDVKKEDPKCQSRHAWKRESRITGNTSAPPLAVDPTVLVTILLKLYLHMFRHENISTFLSGARPSNELFAYPQHHRGSFAATVKAVCSRVHTDTQEVGRQLIKLIGNDKSLMIGVNYLQSLALELSRYHVYSEPWLLNEIRRDPSRGMFCSWKDIPEAVVVTIVVPTSRWKPVYAHALSKGMALVLEGQVRCPGRWQNMYADMHITVGTLTASGSATDDEYSVSIQEDLRGLEGNSTMVASFYVSAAALQLDMQTSLVSLRMMSTVQNMAQFSEKLDQNMTVFETKLRDNNHVYVTKYPPGHSGQPRFSVEGPAKVQLPGNSMTLDLDTSAGVVASITGRLKILSDEGKTLLQDKAPINLEQTSPYTIDVIFGHRTLVQTLTYPVPVTEENSKTRIARKSSYVEVVAKLAEPGVSAALEDYVYPTVRDSTNPTSPVSTLNITHLNLDTLPILDVEDKSSIRFINTLNTFAFSERERRLRESTEANNSRLLPSLRVNFKESIFTMFMLASGLQGGQTGLFAIDHPQRGGLHMLLLVSAIRLDGANCSAVLDAAVIPFTTAMLKDEDLLGFLLVLRTLECCTITVEDAELALWKKALPALAERCRDWSHLPECEYARPGATVPLSLEFGRAGPLLLRPR